MRRVRVVLLLFGIPEKKDAKATGAYAANGIVQRSIRELKKAPFGLRLFGIDADLVMTILLN